MENNILKDMFKQKRYGEVIDMLESLFCDLFVDMLNYKNIPITIDKDDFFSLKGMISTNYPQFLDNIIYLDGAVSNPNNSELKYINALISTYDYMSNEYKTPSDTTFDEDYDFDFDGDEVEE